MKISTCTKYTFALVVNIIFFALLLSGLSDNVSYVVEDLEVKDVSKYRYEINYNPKMWIPVEPKIVD